MVLDSGLVTFVLIFRSWIFSRSRVSALFLDLHPSSLIIVLECCITYFPVFYF